MRDHSGHAHVPSGEVGIQAWVFPSRSAVVDACLLVLDDDLDSPDVPAPSELVAWGQERSDVAMDDQEAGRLLSVEMLSLAPPPCWASRANRSPAHPRTSANERRVDGSVVTESRLYSFTVPLSAGSCLTRPPNALRSLPDVQRSEGEQRSCRSGPEERLASLRARIDPTVYDAGISKVGRPRTATCRPAACRALPRPRDLCFSAPTRELVKGGAPAS